MTSETDDVFQSLAECGQRLSRRHIGQQVVPSVCAATSLKARLTAWRVALALMLSNSTVGLYTCSRQEIETGPAGFDLKALW